MRAVSVAVAAAVVGVLLATVPAGAAAGPVDLGTATDFAVLGPTITNVGPATRLHGDLGLPTGGVLVGFPPGEVVAPAVIDRTADEALADARAAYTDAATRSPDDTLPAALVGTTIRPGVHSGPAATAMSLSGSIVLDGEGDPGAIFVIQVGAALDSAAATRVSLVRGAQACNVFWQVTAAATLGAGTQFAGTILAKAAITVGAGSTIDGRIVALDAAITLDTDTVTAPACDTVDRRPTLAPVGVGTNVGVPVGVTTTGADPEGAALTYEVMTGPAHGSVTMGTGPTRTYTPAPDFVGLDTFTVVATDADGLRSLPATVTVSVGVRTLTGTVTSSATGTPLAGIQVYLIDVAVERDDPPVVATATTDGSGRYDMGAAFASLGGQVPFGTYAIRWVDPSGVHLSVYYFGARNRAASTATVVDAGAAPIIRDAALVAASRIAGTVRSATGAPIAGIQVRLTFVGTSGSASQDTDAEGAWNFPGLEAGSYQLWYRDVSSGRYVSEWHDESTTQAGSTTITLVPGQAVTLDETLASVATKPAKPSATISGTLTSTAGGHLPVGGIQVRLYRNGSVDSTAATTDAAGHYAFAGQAAGGYKLWFRDVSSGRFVSEYHADRSSLATATVVTVSDGGAVVVDGRLAPR